LADSTITILIPGRPPLLNSERAGHWTRHRDSTRTYREVARVKLPQLRKHWPPMQMVKVDVRCFYQKGSIPDVGGCMPAVKAVIDGAVDAGLIKDDHPGIVKHLAMWAPVRDAGLLDQMLVTFQEIDEDSPWAQVDLG